MRAEAEQLALPDGTLALNRRLFAGLEERQIGYCHWKSTPGLTKALAGLTDLDLLVARNDADRFALVVRELGFKPFISHESRRFPGVEDHLGFDEESGRLIHLHVYYQLVLGEEFIKNHRLPLERAFIEGSVLRDGVRVPPPALELLVLVVRTLLKYADPEAAKDLLRLGRSGGIRRSVLDEVDGLAAQVTDADARQAVARHMPALPADLVSRFREVVGTDARDARALLQLRTEVRRALRPYERMSRWQARSRYARARLVRSRLLRPILRGLTRSDTRRKSPLGGGLGIALLGPDGAGKTTIVNELVAWLGWRLNLRVLYLGSSQPSAGTRALKAASKAARAANRAAARATGRGEDETVLAGLTRATTAIRYLADARDRANRVAEGRRLASRGSVVIFDRYPLPGVRLSERMVDGPRIGTISGRGDGVVGALRGREEHIYEAMPPPDHVILLRVSPEVALSRKTGHSAEAVAAKSRAIEEARLRDHGVPVSEVDASRPLEEVVREVKAIVWRLL